MTLDLTMTLGNVIQTALVLGGLLAVYIKIRERLVAVETKLDPLWKEFERRRGVR